MNSLDQQLANRLGFSGLIPFVLLTLGCWIVHPEWLDQLITGQLSYGIAILSFLGGLHWGIVLMSPERAPGEIRQSLIWGVIPTVLAWVSMINMGVGFLVQIVGFVVAYQVDKRLYLRYALPAWFLVLRFRLTCVVVTALALTFIAANVRV
jgi:predicted exporter